MGDALNQKWSHSLIDSELPYKECVPMPTACWTAETESTKIWTWMTYSGDSMIALDAIRREASIESVLLHLPIASISF